MLLCFAWSFSFSLYMKRYSDDGMIDYSDGRWRTRGRSPSVLHSRISSTFFPLILSLFNVFFCSKATTLFIYLLFKFQVDRKKTLRMMKATTLTFRNKIKTYPTGLTLRNKIKNISHWTHSCGYNTYSYLFFFIFNFFSI